MHDSQHIRTQSRLVNTNNAYGQKNSRRGGEKIAIDKNKYKKVKEN